MSSYQAQLPNPPTIGDAIMSLVLGKNVVVQPTKLVVADGQAIPETLNGSLKFLQNCAVAPLLYKIGSAPLSNDDFHGILAGCSAQDDGLGSVVNLSAFQQSIWVKAQTGTPRVCVILANYN